MITNRKLLIPLFLAFVVAFGAASMAFAAGSGSQALGVGAEWHRICISHPKGWSYELEFKVFPNGTAVAREYFDDPALAGGSEYVYGAATRTGYAFAWSYLDFGDTEGNVLLIHRNRTWCEYNFEEDEPDGEECGDWTFGDCEQREARRAPWVRE